MNKEILKDKSKQSLKGSKKKHKGLQIAIYIYGLLYLIFFIVSFIPSENGNPVSDMVPFDPFDFEQIVVKLLFIIFVIGLVMTWKNRLIAGIIFIFWWICMWGLDLLIVAPTGREVGNGIGMGFPLFIIGILYIKSWHNSKSK